MGLDPRIEFHGHPLMQGRGQWKALAEKHREQAAIYAVALHVIDDLDIQFIFQGLDVARLRRRYKNPLSPYSIAMTYT
ncbi:hypothetical protein [Schaalia vaccimaxillae]|uniref:hypothetical protein n=1 Tax=Schaalia vaccimaxillae TaxID=183916 RepID=UPI00103A29F8|nr:hypothetical protein [Schaalia vaccimaxillae]